MFIRSERLFLRPGWPEDGPELLEAIADEAVARNLADMPWPCAAQDAQALIGMAQERLLPRFLITTPGQSSSRIIGGCGLIRISGEAELECWIAPDAWGQGYASEAVGAVLGLARTLGHRRLLARPYVDNAASGRVLEKSGFRRTGRVVERFSQARGFASLAREYEVLFESDGDSDGEDAMVPRRAA